MSCRDCEEAQEAPWVFYIRVDNGNVAVKGCVKHTEMLIEAWREHLKARQGP